MKRKRITGGQVAAVATMLLAALVLCAIAESTAQTLRIPSDIDVRIEGDLEVLGTQPELARTRLVQDNLAVYPQKLTDCRVWDAYQTTLPGTSSGDDLALVGGTYGTGVPSLESSDLKAAGSTTLYARLEVPLPVEYVAGQTVNLVFSAGMVTTVADSACTIDVEAYKSNRDGLKTGSELVNVAAVTMNSLTFADKSFTVTPTTLNPGDTLDVRVIVLVNDAATGTEVKARVGAIDLKCDIKG